MFDQMLRVVQCHLAELIDWEEKEEVVQEIEIIPILLYRCNLTANGSPQEKLVEWIRTIDILFNTIIFLKPFFPMKTRFITC